LYWKEKRCIAMTAVGCAEISLIQQQINAI